MASYYICIAQASLGSVIELLQQAGPTVFSGALLAALEPERALLFFASHGTAGATLLVAHTGSIEWLVPRMPPQPPCSPATLAAMSGELLQQGLGVPGIPMLSLSMYTAVCVSTLLQAEALPTAEPERMEEDNDLEGLLDAHLFGDAVEEALDAELLGLFGDEEQPATGHLLRRTDALPDISYKPTSFGRKDNCICMTVDTVPRPSIADAGLSDLASARSSIEAWLKGRAFVRLYANGTLNLMGCQSYEMVKCVLDKVRELLTTVAGNNSPVAIINVETSLINSDFSVPPFGGEEGHLIEPERFAGLLDEHNYEFKVKKQGEPYIQWIMRDPATSAVTCKAHVYASGKVWLTAAKSMEAVCTAAKLVRDFLEEHHQQLMYDM